MATGGWSNFAKFCREMATAQKKGRPSLRRTWTQIRALVDQLLVDIPDSEIQGLLGKSKAAIDPDESDFKAIISYAIGKGVLTPEKLRVALEADETESPLAFLATLSGKAFGESVAPKICEYWLSREKDQWHKHSGSDYFDISWTPKERGVPVRLELKASSEWPSFRFQQVRDPRFTKNPSLDYDALLCMGVTSGSLEFWFIPATAVSEFIDDGTFKNQHGGKKMPSNTYWFVTDETTRLLLVDYATDAEDLRDLALKLSS